VDDSQLRRQAKIEKALVERAVEATPENWKRFRLALTFVDEGLGREAIRHEIESLEGHRELVSGTMEMFEASGSLSAHFRALGRRLSSVVYEVDHLPSGDWHWRSQYSYEPAL
jgi:hypothetical protein